MRQITTYSYRINPKEFPNFYQIKETDDDIFYNDKVDGFCFWLIKNDTYNVHPDKEGFDVYIIEESFYDEDNYCPGNLEYALFLCSIAVEHDKLKRIEEDNCDYFWLEYAKALEWHDHTRIQDWLDYERHSERNEDELFLKNREQAIAYAKKTAEQYLIKLYYNVKDYLENEYYENLKIGERLENRKDTTNVFGEIITTGVIEKPIINPTENIYALDKPYELKGSTKEDIKKVIKEIVQAINKNLNERKAGRCPQKATMEGILLREKGIYINFHKTNFENYMHQDYAYSFAEDEFFYNILKENEFGLFEYKRYVRNALKKEDSDDLFIEWSISQDEINNTPAEELRCKLSDEAIETLADSLYRNINEVLNED